MNGIERVCNMEAPAAPTTPAATPMGAVSPATPAQANQAGQAVTQVTILMSNTEFIPGKTIVKSLGIVNGSTVRAKNVFKDIGAGLKNIVGGELKAYTELLQEARTEATNRMLADAASRGANAVVNVRFATSSVSGGAAELFAYGTAVQVQ